MAWLTFHSYQYAIKSQHTLVRPPHPGDIPLVLTILCSAGPYSLDEGIIRTDLSTDRPLWILSAYGPGKGAPIQLLGGEPREVSFEELRLRHYELAASGREQEAIQEAQQLYNSAEQQIQQALNDIPGAIRYITEGANQHPNRLDIINGSAAGPAKTPFTGTSGSSINPFVSSGNSAMSPSGLTPTTSSGGSAFGAPSQLQSAFSNPSGSYGKSVSNLGQQQSNPFGQPPANPFAAQTLRPSNPFTVAAGPKFGEATPPTTNPFAQATTSTAPAFGQPTQPTSGFTSVGQSAPSTGFGSIPPASSAPNANPFAQSQPQTQSSPFARPTSSSGPFNAAPAIANVRKDARGRLISFNNQPVTYMDDEPCKKRPDGRWEKIWFPDGPPIFQKEQELPEGYEPAKFEEEYKWVKERGSFKDGKMPNMPPIREWISWNF